MGIDNDPRKRGKFLYHFCTISIVSCSDSIIAVDLYNFCMTLAVSRAFMLDVDKQPVDTDSSLASVLASSFQESMNVHRGTCGSTTVTLHQSFLDVFYMFYIGFY